MNRSIFIVIVDFLLLSLIAFARFDSDQDLTARKGGQLALQDNGPAQKEVVNVLKLSLEEERRAREELAAQLTQTETTLRSREELLADREKRIQESQLSLQRKSEEAQKLAAERATLQTQFAQAQTNLSTLSTKLELTSSEAKASRQRLTSMEADLRKRQEELALATAEAKLSKDRLAAMDADLRQRQDQLIKARTDSEISKERLTLMEADLKKRQEEADRAQKSLAVVEEKRLSAENEKQKLASQLQVQSVKGQVETERKEKAELVKQTGKLAAGVSELAEESEKLKTEIRENRPMAPNTIYSELASNRVQTFIQASRHGLFGQPVDKQKESKTVLIRHSTNTYAILHVDDTPLSFAAPGTDWDRIQGHLRKGVDTAPIGQIYFWATDPRVVIIPIHESYAQRWHVKTYAVAEDPFKFQEAVLVGATENYYGECKFQIDPSNPRYVRMDRNIFKRLVGNFAPSGGDLVFSKTGQVIGVMVNKEYCAVLNNFGSFFNIRAGPDLGAQQTGAILAALQRQLEALPLKLQ
jgi:hypothetical protein